MNRQQRRAKDREREKNIGKMLKERKSMPMNLAEAKKIRAIEWTMSLSKEEQELLMEFANENSKKDLKALNDGLDIVLNVHLNNNTELITKIYDDLSLEGNKTMEYVQKGESYMKKISENKEKIIADYKDLKGKGNKESDIVKELAFKYNITNNAAKNIIGEFKKSIRVSQDHEEKEIEEAVDYIFGKDKNEEVKDYPSYIDFPREENKEEAKKSKYEVLEEQIIIKRTIKGEYGTYRIDNKVMTIDDCAFCKKEEVEQACSEKLIELQKEKDRIEKAMKAAEESKVEAIEIMELYMKI